MTPNLHETLATLVADVAGDVDVWQLERAYLTAGGPLLSVERDTGHVPYTCTRCSFSG
jgi:hypothetical protein